MSQYIVSKNYPNSYEEKERWATESSYYGFQPPNPNAPKQSRERKGWGIQEEVMPPASAVAYVMARFISEVAEYPATDREGYPTEIRPQFKWSVLSTIMAHFLWYHEKEGADYIAGLYNMEEVPAFFSGYTYFYTDPNTKNAKRITAQSEWKLRIWRTTDPEDKADKVAPIVLPDENNMTQMQNILDRARNPYAHGENPVSGDDMYQWVSHQLHDWLIKDLRDPRNPNSISGDQWVRSHERSPGIPFYSFIGNLELFGRKAFRMKDLQGNIVWCGPGDMTAYPNRDLFLHDVPPGMTQAEVISSYQCFSCGKDRNCVPLTGDEKYCAWCYGNTRERNERPALNYCTRSECGGRNSTCPKFISTQRELHDLKSSLNRDADYPVYRGGQHSQDRY